LKLAKNTNKNGGVRPSRVILPRQWRAPRREIDNSVSIAAMKGTELSACLRA
jgi:hypothetical protein